MIHILQQLCPQRHCFAAVAWDDRTGDLGQARHQISQFLERLDQAGVLQSCQICGSGTFHLEDGITRFRTLAEAEPHLVRAQTEQLISGNLLRRSAQRN